MGWTVSYARSVERDVLRLPTDIQKETARLLKTLQETPYPAGCKKLKGARHRYRVRIGREYRLFIRSTNPDR